MLYHILIFLEALPDEIQEEDESHHNPAELEPMLAKMVGFDAHDVILRKACWKEHGQ
jgi:hypothetical protein